jgi:cytochrome b subunit of formate dehydrogenase
LTEKDQTRFLIQIKDFAVDAHWQKGVRCQDCHGGDPTVFEIKAHQSGSEEFRAVKTPADVPKICGNCHKQQALDLVKGVHHAAGPKDKRGVGTILACSRCHADREQQPSHHILPLHDKKSPVFLDNQVKTCGGCHEEFLNTYMKSVHGEGMAKLGLLVTPGCADCHGAHGVYHANDTRSTLHSTNVAATCGKCHRFIEERLQASVHGHGAGGPASKPAPGGNSRLKPSCTNCHQGHDIVDPQSLTFRVNLPNRCGNCHANYSSRYAMSLHGALTALGYGPGAKCSDCHGAHDILPTDDPHSRLSGANRVETCRKCHPYANANFSRFDPHADHKDFETNPVLHVAFVGMELLLFSVFGVFGVHTILWFARSLIHTLRHGRPKKLRPGQQAYLRFEPIHRVLHVVVIVSFLGLALTGLPLKYHEQEWGKTLASALGGFDSTSALHRLCALATVFYASAHLVWLCKKIAEMRRQGAHWMTVVFGPDSPVPNFRDVKDFFCMLGWFFGLKKKPVFERWSYWEKFDYWAVFWGVGIIGTSGLMLWFPNFFTLVLPGWALNVAKLIHSEEALLATGFIFAIHFFNTHLRADKFPIDPVIFTGAISEEELHEERPEYFDRVKREGRLGQIRTTMPSRTKLWFILLGGATALTIGTGLLVAMVLAGLRH